jgi:UDP-N-acetylmuramoylalanine--D-glutamate ligase
MEYRSIKKNLKWNQIYGIRGKHNIKYNGSNLCGKIEVKWTIQSLSNFQGVEHRLEKILKIQNVQLQRFKATNVNATFSH